jgi:hypothetical protein
MKRFYSLLTAFAVTTGALAQTTANFNSSSNTPLSSVKATLQNECWQFPGMDVNQGQWKAGIEGDGAMISASTATRKQNTGIYTQLLALHGNTDFSFSYKFDATVTARRWLKLLLTDGNNNVVVKIDSVELTGKQANVIYQYSNRITAVSGWYKLYINYQGIESGACIAIDQLLVSAAACYSKGCNEAPIAKNDVITGASDHTASGSVLGNDEEPNSEPLNAQLVTNSPDGKVVLNTDGSFTFTPNANFSGSNTKFTYMICDNGSPALCSNIATATINFQTINSALPASLIDLAAAYENSKVVVNWTTTFEENSDHFEIERSIDGINYKTVGSVNAQGKSAVKHDYNFSDDVSNATMRKNDLYYRLKLVDKDNKPAFSKVLVVRVYKTKSLQSVSVTPNPTVNDIKLKVQLNENSFIVMKVVNNAGTEVIRKSTRGITGGNNFTLEGSSQLHPGIYYLEVIINSNERMIVKLVKN